MVDPDPLVVMAANLASWHDTSVRALGWRPHRSAAWWTCPTPAPNIYHSAIALRPVTDADDERAVLAELAAHLSHPDSCAISVCDPWDRLDLTAVGLTRRARGESAHRPPGPLPPWAGEAGLDIAPVTTPVDLEAFERTVIEGFGARFPVAPYDIHGLAILDDPSMHVLLGRADGQPVSAAMAYLAAGAIGVYGVTTVPAARGRGHATAITRAALAVDLARSAVLQPTPAAAGIYARLDFTTVGPFAHWV